MRKVERACDNANCTLRFAVYLVDAYAIVPIGFLLAGTLVDIYLRIFCISETSALCNPNWVKGHIGSYNFTQKTTTKRAFYWNAFFLFIEYTAYLRTPYLSSDITKRQQIYKEVTHND